jgi:2-dehydropantoate 2-reductase
MKVAVVGPGAMGCLYAFKLARSGNKVQIVDHRADRAAQLETGGICVENSAGKATHRIPVTTHMPTGQDLILVMTKAHSTASLRFPPETPVLSLQNGLGNVETLCGLVGSARVLAGTTSEAATLVEVGHTHHTGTGITRIGAWTSCDPEPVIAALTNAGFRCESTDSPGQAIWEKAAVNAGINPLTALLGVPNGRLLDIVEARQLMRDLVVEAAKVASTEGYRFEKSLVEIAEEICEATAENISSMLQDVRAGKHTEIEAISGEILRRAQLASLPTPRTRVVYQLMRGLESR